MNISGSREKSTNFKISCAFITYIFFLLRVYIALAIKKHWALKKCKLSEHDTKNYKTNLKISEGVHIRFLVGWVSLRRALFLYGILGHLEDSRFFAL